MTDCFICLLQSLDDFGDEDDEEGDDRGYEEDNEDDQDYLEDKDERKEKKESGTLHTEACLKPKHLSFQVIGLEVLCLEVLLENCTLD